MPNFTQDEKQLLEKLSDWKWRIRNLYYIKDFDGNKVLFKPNWAQQRIIDNLWFFSIILKARQLGMTTLFCIIYLDQVLFNNNKTAGIIAHKQDDAKRFFNDKVKFAWDNLPSAVKDTIGQPNTDSVGEMSFSNGSKIFVSTSVRGGTLQFLHISEFGKICAVFPQKAKEIVTGSINAVAAGNFVTIESTAEGREGYYYKFCKDAEKMAKEGRELSPLDYKFFFFPWWQEPTYTLDAIETLPKELDEYFNNLENKHGIKLTEGQKQWYFAKKKTNQEDMFSEYPSTPDEPFMVSNEGAYYAAQMGKVYEQGRVMKVPYDSALPVDTWWDLGMNDSNVIIFTQSFGNEIRFIDTYFNHGEGLNHYINVLKEKGYIYGKHTFPHDVRVRNLDKEGKSRLQILYDLGLTNIRIVDKTKDLNKDIELVRQMFSRFYFDEKNCARLLDALNNYRKEWDDKLGTWKSYPRHDDNSHFADAMRAVAVGWQKQEIDPDQYHEEQYVDFF